MGRWVRIGRLSKAKGKKGDLEVRASAGLPFLFSEGQTVHFVPPRLEAPRQARVVRVAQTGPDSAVVSFDLVSTWEDALELEGCCCLAARADLPGEALAATEGSLVGYAVVDAEAGRVGVIEGFVENPAHPLAAVVPAGGGDALLVPWVDDFLASIDDETRTVFVRLPRGLVDL